jgi:hypothetical protein
MDKRRRMILGILKRPSMLMSLRNIHRRRTDSLKQLFFNLGALLITGALFSLNGGCTTTKPQTRLVPHTEPVAIVYRNLDIGSITTNTVYVDGFVEEEIPVPEPEPITAEDVLEGVLMGVGTILNGQSGTL